MAERILSEQSSPDSRRPGNGKPPEVCLTSAEWQEIADCSLALHAAIHNCEGLEGDEAAELTRSVQMRLSQAVHKVELRIFGE